MYGASVIGLVALESYFCHPRRKSLYNMTRRQLTAKETTLPFRQKIWVQLPVCLSMATLVFCAIYPPFGYTPLEKIGLLSIAVTVRILVSGKIYIPMRMKPACKKIMAFRPWNPFNPGPFNSPKKEEPKKKEETSDIADCLKIEEEKTQVQSPDQT